ncbi:hypothetical protein B484DRAFT_317141, partial [Ochromonadaceae sp. CCMP2298]
QYIYSIYWAIALLTTVGYGDITPITPAERVYNVVLFILGTVVYAVVIVNLQDLVSQLDVTADIAKERAAGVGAFLRREAVGAEVLEKGRKYMDVLW